MPNYKPENLTERPEPGEYAFIVRDAKDAVSANSGNDMIVMDIGLEIPGKAPYFLKDRLVFTDKALFRIKNFCDGVGLDFDRGSVTVDDVIALEGRCMIRLGKANHEGRQFLEIAEYLPKEGDATAQVVDNFDDFGASSGATRKDDIPY